MGIVMAMVKVPQGLSLSALTTTQRDHGKQNDQDRDDRGVGDESADDAGFFFGHFGERLAVAADGK